MWQNPYFINFIAFLVGVAASTVVWYASIRLWRPKLLFSEELCAYELPSGKFIYQVRFKNIGSRDIVDVDIYARFGIEGFKGSSLWAYHTVRTNTSKVPILKRNDTFKVRVFDQRESLKFIDMPSLSIQENMLACTDLKEILNLGRDGFVRVHVFGNDAFSGVRAHFQSEPYRIIDIRKGRFKNLDIVNNDKLESYRSGATSSNSNP